LSDPFRARAVCVRAAHFPIDRAMPRFACLPPSYASTPDPQPSPNLRCWPHSVPGIDGRAPMPPYNKGSRCVPPTQNATFKRVCARKSKQMYAEFRNVDRNFACAWTSVCSVTCASSAILPISAIGSIVPSSYSQA
jgi:hypothetical protein